MEMSLYVLMAAIAGGLISLQAAANASLRTNLQDARWATFFSICGTIITGIVVMLMIRPPFPSPAAMRSAPWWNWIGGPLGAVIVLSGAALTPKMGAAAFIASVVGGQLICSILLDHLGWMNLPQQGLSPTRVLGAAMVFDGVLLVTQKR
jgi:transporter family-2 protein